MINSQEKDIEKVCAFDKIDLLFHDIYISPDGSLLTFLVNQENDHPFLIRLYKVEKTDSKSDGKINFNNKIITAKRKPLTLLVIANRNGSGFALL